MRLLLQCVAEHYNMRNRVSPKAGRSKATTLQPVCWAKLRIMCLHENSPAPNPWIRTTPMSLFAVLRSLGSTNCVSSCEKQSTDGFYRSLCRYKVMSRYLVVDNDATQSDKPAVNVGKGFG
eukprot:scaffold425918_cov35-Prasinocladus_malaysianus.AAC.3